MVGRTAIRHAFSRVLLGAAEEERFQIGRDVVEVFCEFWCVPADRGMDHHGIVSRLYRLPFRITQLSWAAVRKVRGTSGLLADVQDDRRDNSRRPGRGDRCRAASGARAVAGPALRVRLPPDTWTSRRADDANGFANDGSGVLWTDLDDAAVR